MNNRGYLVILYGVLLFVGGLIGHLKAGSYVSLVTGSICGALALLAGFGMVKGWPYSKTSALVLSSVLFLFFLYRFSLSLRFMPSGLMAILSLLVIFMLLVDKIKR